MTVSDGRTIEVNGRDALVGRPSAKGMFRVIAGLTPSTAYTVTVAAVTAAGAGPAVTVKATTKAGWTATAGRRASRAAPAGAGRTCGPCRGQAVSATERGTHASS